MASSGAQTVIGWRSVTTEAVETSPGWAATDDNGETWRHGPMLDGACSRSVPRLDAGDRGILFGCRGDEQMLIATYDEGVVEVEPLEAELSPRALAWFRDEPALLMANDLTTLLRSRSARVPISNMATVDDHAAIHNPTGFGIDPAGGLHVLLRLYEPRQDGGYTHVGIVYVNVLDGRVVDERVIFEEAPGSPSTTIARDDFHDIVIQDQIGLVVWAQNGQAKWASMEP